jgi:hypothetical protein
MSRDRAETIPAVTVPPSPNGLPTAITHSPMHGAWSAISTDLNPGPPSTLSSAMRVARHEPCRIGIAVVGLDGDRCAMLDHMIGGDGVAIRGDEEAGPLTGCRAGMLWRRRFVLGRFAEPREKARRLIVRRSSLVHHLRAYSKYGRLYPGDDVLKAARRRPPRHTDGRLEPRPQNSAWKSLLRPAKMQRSQPPRARREPPPPGAIFQNYSCRA